MTSFAIGEPGLRIDIVELGGADEGVHRGRPHAAAVGAGEQLRLSAQSNPSERALGSIVCEADAAVVEEAGEEVPAPEHVIHRLGHGLVDAWEYLFVRRLDPTRSS